ncbi:MAG TPA: DUF6599 family protein [Candidatus Acidoferrum sp.]|nr:DUF6599 family protein [Candidatus Acidoferrum sp.]
MRRQLLLVCGIALLSATSLSAQRRLLPKQFKSWQLTSCVSKPAHFAFGKEAGERDFSSCGFSSGDKTIGISAGRYQDSSSAFQIYTSQLRAGMVPTNLGQISAFDRDGVLVLEGSLVLSSTANISREDLSALVKTMEASIEKAPLPPIRTYLPGAGRLLGTERYALGPEAMRAAMSGLGQTELAGLVDAAGFSSGAEAMLARYASRGRDSGVLVLLEYPTPQLAEQHIHHLDELLPAAARQAGTVIERKGSLLSMVLSPSSAEYAKNLREAVDYETQVTWNEASQTATDPPITSVMVKIFIGTGVFMVAAVVLGIAFGGVRVVTKRLFPGRVFDRPNQMEVLQLGLSGKRIDPSDFY